MSLFPIFIKLENRPCLVVGAGNVGLEKIRSLLAAGARLTVVAPRVSEPVEQLAAEGKLALVRRCFQESDLDNQSLVVTATDSPETNRAIFLAARERHLLANSVDDAPNCDFYFASIVERGPLQIAISTAGESPALAQRLRREIDAQLPADTGAWLTQLGALRREVLATHPPGEPRKALLHELAHRPACAAAECPSRQLAFPAKAKTAAQKGTVYLVGAGPGNPELLTLKAANLIAAADVILHDDLVPQAILDRAGANARIVSVGKRCGARRITQPQIHALMIEEAQRGASVVRLKSGDPLIFGRAGEEIEALEQAGIPFEIVPGVTAMFAAAAAIKRPLTDRRSASKIILTTAHHAAAPDGSQRPAVWRGDLPHDATLGIYMPGRDLATLGWEMLAGGLPADLPCVILSNVSLPDQRMKTTTLAELGDFDSGAAPILVLAGWPLANLPQAELIRLTQFAESTGAPGSRS